jgi:hypothetical protein
VELADSWHPQNPSALADISEGGPSMKPTMIPVSVVQKEHLPEVTL